MIYCAAPIAHLVKYRVNDQKIADSLFYSPNSKCRFVLSGKTAQCLLPLGAVFMQSTRCGGPA